MDQGGGGKVSIKVAEGNTLLFIPPGVSLQDVRDGCARLSSGCDPC